MPKQKRNYRKEYDNYQGKKKQIKNRTARLEKLPLVKALITGRQKLEQE